jgi:hypothetical protein
MSPLLPSLTSLNQSAHPFLLRFPLALFPLMNLYFFLTPTSFSSYSSVDSGTDTMDDDGRRMRMSLLLYVNLLFLSQLLHAEYCRSTEPGQGHIPSQA